MSVRPSVDCMYTWSMARVESHLARLQAEAAMLESVAAFDCDGESKAVDSAIGNLAGSCGIDFDVNCNICITDFYFQSMQSNTNPHLPNVEYPPTC